MSPTQIQRYAVEGMLKRYVKRLRRAGVPVILDLGKLDRLVLSELRKQLVRAEVWHDMLVEASLTGKSELYAQVLAVVQRQYQDQLNVEQMEAVQGYQLEDLSDSVPPVVLEALFPGLADKLFPLGVERGDLE